MKSISDINSFEIIGTDSVRIERELSTCCSLVRNLQEEYCISTIERIQKKLVFARDLISSSHKKYFDILYNAKNRSFTSILVLTFAQQFNIIENLRETVANSPSIRDWNELKANYSALSIEAQYLRRKMKAFQSKSERVVDKSTRNSSIDQIQRDKVIYNLQLRYAKSDNHTDYAEPCKIVLSGYSSSDRKFSQIIGDACQDIVAGCCYHLDLLNVRDLLPYIRTTSRLARYVPSFHAFVDEVEELLDIAKGNFTASVERVYTENSLQIVLKRLKCFVQEYSSLKSACKPPHTLIHKILVQSMKLTGTNSLKEMHSKLQVILMEAKKDSQFIQRLKEAISMPMDTNRDDLYRSLLSYIKLIGLNG